MIAASRGHERQWRQLYGRRSVAERFDSTMLIEGHHRMCHIRHMRNVTIRKLHEETGRIVDAAQAGEVIIVRRRGVAVAELRAIAGSKLGVRIPNFNRRYAKFPAAKTDSGKIQEEDRR